MAGPDGLVCHRIQLFGECLARSLTDANKLHFATLAPEHLVTQLDELELETQVQLLLLDAALPEGNAFIAADKVRQRFPVCKTILLVSEAAMNQLLDLAQLAAYGCVDENIRLSELCSAIQVVLSGRPYCSPPLANALLAQLGTIDYHHRWSHHLTGAHLTAREREILGMIALEQLGNKQIARRLHVSLYTVKNHVHNIIEKLGVEDRYEAVQVARNQHLLVKVEAAH
jgi:DNA-binding NarL/FixJ family response regulator